MDPIELLLLNQTSLHALLDAYTLLAGIGNGYTNALLSKSNFTKEEAQASFLKLDKQARDMVGEALTVYLNQKEDGDKT